MREFRKEKSQGFESLDYLNDAVLSGKLELFGVGFII